MDKMERGLLEEQDPRRDSLSSNVGKAESLQRREEKELDALSDMARRRRMHYIGLPIADLKKECRKRGLLEEGGPDISDKHQLIERIERDDYKKESFATSNLFETIMAFIVILNAVAIGVQIDNPSAVPVHGWMIMNLCFFMAFIAEMVVKLRAFGTKGYLLDGWNVFDAVVTVMVAIQIITYYTLIEHRFLDEYNKYVAGDFVQILRLCRLARLARVFKELGVLIQSFISSLKALGWILVLGVLWFYLAACIATVFIGRREWLPSEDEEAIRELRFRFNSIPHSMFALFEVMTLEGWTDYVRPFLNTRPHMVAFFFLFIFITSFFLLNLVTAVVVDRTVAAQSACEEEEAEELTMQRNAHINVIVEILQSKNAEQGGGDLMDKELFNSAITDPEIIDSMKILGWSEKYMQSMFALIDYDNDGEASLRSIQKILIASNQALDTANYVRFQINLAHRLEFQEKLTLTVLHALEKIGQTKFELPESMPKIRN